MSESNIWNWENNRCLPALRFIPKIIDFLGFAPYKPEPSFAEWLKILRFAKGLSQKELAQTLGMDESTINGWERGRHRPTHQFLQRIRSFFTASKTHRT